MNNYDRIRQMTLDEMADFINRVRALYCQYKERNFNCKGCFIKDLCCDLPMSKTKQWLQESEEENDDKLRKD